MTSLRILGPVQAWGDDRPLSLGGPKQIKLLAFLLLHANEAVSADALVDAVWGPARQGSDNRLQMAVTRLRKALEPLNGRDGSLLHTVTGGYLLTVATGALDADVFTRAIGEGRRALDDGDPAQAANVLQAALELWRGPPLAEVAFDDFAQPEIRRLEELRLTALETRLEAELSLGRHAEAVGELEALLTDQPTRERFAALLMLALYRAGRQAEALEAYRRTRAHLVDELGIEPGRELQQLHEAMLAHDSGLDWTATAPVHADAGVRVTRPAPDVQRHNLPAVRSSFVDREETVGVIEASMETSRVVSLTGVGGVGKTRLALEVAERSLERWPDGAWLVELATVGHGSGVAEAVAATLSLDVSHDRSPLDEIANRLEERHLLLVMDNCEHVLDACAALAARIARGRSGSRLLATSRAPLAVAGERVVPVQPLPVEVDTADREQERSGAGAVALFLQRARDARAEVAIDEPQLDAVGDLCRALDGLPLAIELAASRVRAMTPSQILTHLGDRLALVGYERDRDARHRDLETTIRWSYDLLADRQRQVFRRLCAFPAPFTLAAAERLVGGPGVAEAILGLVDNSLLVVAQQPSGTRYRMLDTIREFGLRQLGDSGEEAEIRDRYLDWACELAAGSLADAEARGRMDVLPYVEAEYRNLLAPLTSAGAVDRRLRLGADLTALLFASTSLREIHHALEQVMSEAGDENTAEIRVARLWLGRVMCKLGELDVARAHLAVTATYAESAGDRVHGAAIAADQALVEIKSGRQPEAEAFLDRSYALAPDVDGEVGSYRLLVDAQMHYDLLGDLEGARDLYESCIEQVRRHGPAPQLITALAALAELSVDLDDPVTAERCAAEVLAIADPVADAYSRGGAVLALGRAALRAGRPVQASGWLIDGARADIQRGSMETPETLESLAHAVAQAGGASDGALVLGAAAAMRRRLGLDPLKREQARIDAALAAVRDRISEVELQQRLYDGGRLGERDLLALVDGMSLREEAV
jgi:predicted ATPase/DNA-binding SARP family transcriptional activator